MPANGHWRYHSHRLAVAIVLALGAADASAKTIVVNSTNDAVDDDVGDFICHTDAGECTLRAAVMQASRTSDDVDVVNIIVPAGVYQLNLLKPTGGRLKFSNGAVNNPPIHLIGAGAATTIIDANHIDGAFLNGTLRSTTISGVTIENGYADTSTNGGGIYNGGALALSLCRIVDNTALYGGGIYNFGVLSVDACTIDSNTATYSGGGIFGNGGTYESLNMFGSTVSRNQASSGAGMFEEGSMIAVDTTLANNTAQYSGGGMFANGVANLYNCTISGNSVDPHNEHGGIGAGMYVGQTLPPAKINIYNTIVAANFAYNTPPEDDCFGALSTHARNRFGSTAGCAITQVSGAYAVLSPNSLGALQYNGGTTETIALLAGSNAIDAGDPVSGCRDSISQQIVADQRGFPRNVGVCDLGAYEFGAKDPNDIIFKDGFQ